MIDIFTAIYDAITCFFSNFIGYVELAAIDIANTIVAGLAATLVAILPYLPSMPSFPSLGDNSYWGWLNWVLPVSSIVALGGAVITLVFAAMAFAIALRWIKAL